MREPPTLFVRQDDDDAWDHRLPCEAGPDCKEGPLCLSKVNRDAMRVALGTVVEAMEAVAMVQSVSQDYWGGCTDPECLFEARMQAHFSTAGKELSLAFIALLEGVQVWKTLPATWSHPEEEAAVRAVLMLRALGREALRQTNARVAGSPDPREPYHTDPPPADRPGRAN